RHWKEAKKSQKYLLFVAEVPLLFEAGLQSWYEATVAVVAPVELCKKRFCALTGYDEGEYERRASLQESQVEKAKKANYIIENTGSVKELEAKARSLFSLLSKGEYA